MTLQTQSAPVPAVAGAAEPIWFASYPPGIPKSIDPDSYPSLSAMLLDACARHAAHPAFECLGMHMTYTEWERLSRSFAAFLIEEAKCQPGDRDRHHAAEPAGLSGGVPRRASRRADRWSMSIRSTRRVN